MKNIFYVLVIFIVFGATSCTGIYENGKEMADDAKTIIEEISVDDLKAKIENGEEFHLIDIRTPKEFKSGFINQNYDYSMYLEPINMPRGILEFQISNEAFWENYFEGLPHKDSTEIIIYCKSGARGILATETLLKLGYKNVKNLSGGWQAWRPDLNDGNEQKVESGCGG